MIIKFQSHSDYVLATTILVRSIEQANVFNELTSLFYEANKSIETKLLGDIKLSKQEIEIINNNNERLWEVLNEHPENKKLECLVHSFCDVACAVEYIRESKHSLKT